MHITTLPAFSDNYIFALRCEGGTVVVDPGDAAVVEQHLHSSGTQLLAILITHHHPDHIGGVAQLAQRWPHAERIGPVDDRIAGLTRTVADGDLVELASDCRLRVIATPGHTRSHIVYADAASVFCGDVLFSLGCGRVFEGDAAQMQNSLDRLAALDDATRIYCAHEYTLSNARFAMRVDPDNPDLKRRVGEVQTRRDHAQPSIPTDIGSELRCNPFLRCDEPAVRNAASAHAGRSLGTRTEVFAELRAWKNLC